MRASVSDANRSAFLAVKLDGVVVPFAFAADDEEGWVDRYVCENGLVKISRDGPLRERAMGKVEFVPPGATT